MNRYEYEAVNMFYKLLSSDASDEYVRGYGEALKILGIIPRETIINEIKYRDLRR